MLNYFRINDPNRLIAIILLLLFVRVPFYIFGDVLSEGDIRLFALGEKVATGKWLYTDILTTEPVLSGLFYGAIHVVVGKSLVIYHIIAFLLVIFQVYLFNRLVIDNRASLSQTYYPGLFYGLFISLFPASFTLHPTLIALTFVLIAMNFQFNHLEFRAKRDEKIIVIGIFLSIASLFLSAGILYLLTAYIVFILFTNTLYRRYLLLLFGFILPYILIGGLYILRGSSNQYYSSLFSVFDTSFSAPVSFWILLLIPVLFLIRAIPNSFLSRRFTNYQASLNQAMLLWLITSVVVMWFGRSEPKQLFLLVVPASALYFTHLFISMRSRLKGFAFMIFFVVILLSSTLDWLRPPFVENLFEKSKQIQKVPNSAYLDKSILVLDKGFEKYRGATHSTPFFDWSLSSTYFDGEPTYENISIVSRGFLEDPPEIIIDVNNQFGKYVSRIPRLRQLYIQNSNGTWTKK